MKTENNESDCLNVIEPGWFALHSHPNKESFLEAELIARSLHVYYPCLHVKPVNPRSRKIRPYFPGYLFVFFDRDHLRGESVFRWIPHAYGLVCFGGIPAPVPEALIQRIMWQLEQAHNEMNHVVYQKGEPVQVRVDLFSGYEAIFDTQLPGSERVRVLLKMLNHNLTPLELNLSQIEKKKKPPGF
jgi:transcription antitermination factor NusG